MRRRRLKLTLVGPLFIALILIVSFILEVIIGVQQGTRITKERVLNSSKATLSVVARVISDPLYSMDTGAMEEILRDLLGGDTSVVHVVVRDAAGRVVTEVTGAWSPSEQDSLELAAQALEAGAIVSREIGDYLLLSGPVTSGLEQIGTLELAFAQTQLQASFGTMQVIMSGLTVVIVIVAVVAVSIIARHAIAPLRELTAAAEEIGQGHLDVHVPVRGSEEMADLGVSLERMRTDLSALYKDLERQVGDLERLARYQDATGRVARDVAAMLNVDDLLSRVVTLVSEQFGFYHTGIFMLDPTGEWAELRAASSEGGERMLARKHRLRVGQEGIVGYVAGWGDARVASDVGEDAVYFDNPDLLETRSEVALPLRARREVLGVLDVQSTVPEAFTDEDVAMLQTLADQVATAISNAQLFQQLQEAMEAERRAYGEMSLSAWAEALRGGGGAMGYHCDANAVVPVTGPVEVEDDGLLALDVPIVVQDQVVGTIRARKPLGTGEWTDEEAGLMEALVGQLGLALESARLYQDTQRRAARERLIAEVTGRMRETLDLETVLKVAAQELRRSLGLPEVVIRLAPEQKEVGRR